MMNTVKILGALVLVVLLGACSESAPETTPVTLNLTLASPNRSTDPKGAR